MNRRNLLSLAFTFALAAGLGACTSFAPVYGDRVGTGMQSVRFNFAVPDSRLEQLIINRLKIAFPGQATIDDPVLDIAAASSGLPGSMSTAYEVARPVNIRVEATVSITQNDTGLFSATRFSDTAYQNGKLTPVDMESATGAQETAARSVAEALRIAILAGYRPSP